MFPHSPLIVLRLVLIVPLYAYALATYAHSASEAVCQQYTQAALAAQQQNLANGCGLVGDPWSLNHNGHRSWCLGASQASVDAETNARSNAISKCMTCNAYAQSAVSAQQQNLANGCGRSGDPWSLNFDGHRSWCMGAPVSSIVGAINARRDELAKCNSCSAYAQEAVAAQQQNLANSCGRAGDPWSINFAGHKSWCMGAPQATIDRETGARRAALDKCNRCNAYAQEAVSAQHQNTSLCAFAGDIWSTDFAGHRAWCMGASESEIAGGSFARRFALDRCISRCRAYGSAAVEAQEQNINNGCNYVGNEWSRDLTGHMTWCVGAPDSVVDREERARRSLLAACLSPGKKAACEAYARTAIGQFARISGTAARCEYRDRRRWHGDFQNHYNWCMAVDLGLPPQEVKAREQELIRCATATSPEAGPGQAEQCSVSVTMKNEECLNLDGSPSTILTPGTLSTFGCGADDDAAGNRAKASLAWLGMCLSEGGSADPGCCKFTEEVSQGCLCR